MKAKLTAFTLFIVLAAACAMAATRTPNIGLKQPATGEAGWLNSFNMNFQALDARIQELKNSVPANSLQYGTSVLSKWVADPSIITDQADAVTPKSLANIIAGVSGAPMNLRLPPGIYLVDRDFTIPETTCLEPDQGAKLSVTNGHKLTIGRLSEATGAYRIFDTSGGGSVQFLPGAVGKAHAEWFGYRANGTGTENQAALQTAAEALYELNIPLQFTESATVTGPLRFYGNISLEGTGIYAPIIRNNATDGSALFHFKNTKQTNQTTHNVLIKNLTLTGNPSSGDGAYFYGPYCVILDRVQAYNNGGIGFNFQKGDPPYAHFQNIRVTDCEVAWNLSGGIRFGGGGNLAIVDGGSINLNGHYGIYSERCQTLRITGTELAGYWYGSVVPGQQDVALAINGGTTVDLQSLSFENNAGSTTTPSKVVRFGWDGDNNIPAAMTTQSVIMRSCYFTTPDGAAAGLVDYVQLDYVQDFYAEGNFFDNAVKNYPYRINAFNIGTVGAYSHMTFVNNTRNIGTGLSLPLLAGNVANHQITLIDDYDSPSGNTRTYQFRSANDSDVAMATYKANHPDLPVFTIGADGKFSWGPGNGAVDTFLYRYGSGSEVLKTDGKFIASGGIGIGNAVAGDATGNPKAYKAPVYDANGALLGYIQIYSGQ